MSGVLSDPAPTPSGPFVASLPMYDLPEVRAATDELWGALAAALRRHGVDAPETLTRGEAALEAAWSAPNLLLSQTCGYPLTMGLTPEVTLIATPAYRAPGCEGAAHRAAIVVRADAPARSLAELRGRRCAVNQVTSNTGMNLLRAEVAAVADGPRFFGEVAVSGSHVASVERVARGAADVASIDAVTLELLRRHRPSLARAVRVLAWTTASPGLPLITNGGASAFLRGALRQSLADVAEDKTLGGVRDALLLDGFVLTPRSDYLAIPDLAYRAAGLGYPTLA